MRHNSPRTARRAIALTGVLVSLLAAGRAGWAQNDVTPLAPDATAYGMTLGEWAMAWWQWAISIPASSNPNTAPNFHEGKFSAVGQRMPVWFLPRVLIAEAEAIVDDTTSLTVPAGQAVLCPILHGLKSDRPGHANAAQLLAAYAPYYERITVLEASVDGVPIQDLQRYRVRSPLFTVFLPEEYLSGERIDGAPLRRAAVTDGYWLLLPPLPVGPHVIRARFETTGPAGNARKYKYTYNVVVVEPNAPNP